MKNRNTTLTLYLCYFFVTASTATGLDPGVVKRLTESGYVIEIHNNNGDSRIGAAWAYLDDDTDSLLHCLEGTEQIEWYLDHFEGEVSVDLANSIASNCKSMKKLRLGARFQIATEVTENVFNVLRSAPQLRDLEIENLRFSDDIVESEPQQSQLVRLSVSGVLNDRIPFLLATSQLKQLELRFQDIEPRMNATDLSALVKQKELESLRLFAGRESSPLDLDLIDFSELIHLKELSLCNCKVDPSRLSLAPCLERVNLRNCRLTHDGLSRLLLLKDLREIIIWECTNSRLGIGQQVVQVTSSLQSITIASPVLSELKVFELVSIPISLHIGSYSNPHFSKSHNITEFRDSDVDEVLKLNGLREFSVGGKSRVDVDLKAFNRLAERVESLSLRDGTRLVEIASGGNENRRTKYGLVQLSLQTSKPYSEGFVATYVSDRLKRLAIYGPMDASEGVDSPKIRNLTKLDISAMRLPAKDGTLLLKLLNDSIKSLSMSYCSIDTGGIQQVLVHCPQLSDIALIDCRFDADCVELLAKHPALDTISVYGNCDDFSVFTRLKAGVVRCGSFAPMYQSPFVGFWEE